MAKKKAKQNKKSKALLKAINPITIMGKKNFFTFIGVVLLITFLFSGYHIIREYQDLRTISTFEQQKRTFTETEYALLLQTPTIQDYIFPNQPLNFRVSYQPWRSAYTLRGNEVEFIKVWIDPRDMQIRNLPERSRQNLIDYIADLRAADPQF
jgi:hypothetical protein